MKTHFYNRGQSLIGIIIVLVIVGLLGGGFYAYLSKQIPEMPKIPEKPAEEVVVPPEEITPPPEEELPEEEIPSKEVAGQVSCVRETTRSGVTCGGNFYEDYCENLADGTGYANLRQCSASTGGSCSLLLSVKKTFCSYGCQNGVCLSEEISPKPIVQKCTDGTPYGQCSTSKPKYCENGNLIDKASLCGCPVGYEVSDNRCVIKITCQNECSSAGLKRCSDNGYQICGNYDADTCLEWSSIIDCPSNTICQNGTCKTTGNLNWEIVFTHTGERLPDTIKNDLCTGSGTNKLSYLPTWFKREANKYGISLSISLNCYSQQIELPQNVLTNPDHYTAFGQSIPLPLNMAKTRDYILQTVPSSQNYDLITIVNYVTSGGSIAAVSSIGGKVSFVFIVKSNFIDGVQYYAPNVTEPNIESDPTFAKSVAHEALHNLGAYDHYDYSNPGDCQTETDQSLRYISPRIMCAANLINFADYIIPPETAKEIGWTK